MRKILNMIILPLKFILFLVVLIVLFMVIWQENTAPAADGEVEVFCLKTQNDAACTLLKQGNAVIMIDTGEAVDAPAIAAFLHEMGVERIDYLILTHPDKDHIGGAAYLMDQVEVRHVIQPYYAKENELASALDEKIDTSGIPRILPVRPRNFICGGMQITVYPPLERHYRKDNNYSLAIRVRHGDVNIAFAGDAEEKRLNELMHVHWPAVDLYQVAHHGRASPSSGLFIDQLRPQYAVIQASVADEAVKIDLEQVGAQIMFTVDGTQQFVSDGAELRWVEEEIL